MEAGLSFGYSPKMISERMKLKNQKYSSYATIYRYRQIRAPTRRKRILMM
tara:strand:+ start:9470 stop:9619 length:150 start_codon:yes stop_codon:yes gene_type:complete